MLSAFLILIINVGFTFCGHAQSSREDDSLVYAAMIRLAIPETTKSVLIVDETVTYHQMIDTTAIVDSNSSDPNEIRRRKYEWEIATKTPFDSIAYRPLVRYYMTEHTRIRIPYRFSFPFSVRYLSRIDFQKGKDTDAYWKRLERKYPATEGILTFSEVFYSVDRSRAVAYYAIQRKNGKGAVMGFQKVNGTWERKFEFIVWHN